MAGPPLTVRPFEPGDEHAINDLFARTFGRKRSLEEWRWRFEEAPIARRDISVLCFDGRVVGHVGRVGYPTFVNGRRAVCRVSGDMMVDPDFRGRGGFGLLLEDGADQPYDVRLHSPNEVARFLWSRMALSRPSLTMTQWVRWQPPILAPLWRFRRRWARDLRVELLTDPGEEVDEMAEASALWAPVIRVRDARYLRWRWLDQPGTDWRLLAARSADGRLRGVVAYGVDPWAEAPTGRIVDLLAGDRATTTALLAASADALARRRLTRVAFAYEDPRPWSARACVTAGFIRRGTGPDVAGACWSDCTRPAADTPSDWYLPLGDTDLA